MFTLGKVKMLLEELWHCVESSQLQENLFLAGNRSCIDLTFIFLKYCYYQATKINFDRCNAYFFCRRRVKYMSVTAKGLNT